MSTFFMFGNYTSDAVKEISIKRTEQAIDTIQQLGGEVNGVYALITPGQLEPVNRRLPV